MTGSTRLLETCGVGRRGCSDVVARLGVGVCFVVWVGRAGYTRYLHVGSVSATPLCTLHSEIPRLHSFCLSFEFQQVKTYIIDAGELLH